MAFFVAIMTVLNFPSSFSANKCLRCFPDSDVIVNSGSCGDSGNDRMVMSVVVVVMVMMVVLVVMIRHNEFKMCEDWKRRKLNRLY
jgi:hypothetical protein